MQSRSDLKVGIEMRVMAGALTGVGNYSLNLLEALVSDYAYLQYAGFGLLSWKAVDAAALKRIEAAKSSRAETKGFAADRIDSLRTMVRKRLSQSDLALTLYRMQFSRTVKRQSFDLFHAFNFLPFADPGVVTLPVIYDLSFIRYPDAHPPERMKRLSGLPALLDRAPLVQTISQFSRNEISAVYGYPKERIFVAPPAANKVFRPLGAEVVRGELREFGISMGNYLLAVGTLEPRKNLRTLITAYAGLPKAVRSAAPLVIVGGAGWGELDLPIGTSALLSEGSLIFLGSVSNSQLRSLYEGAIALLFPSIYEGFGMPVVEAMACGTPVVHSEDTSMDEITHGLATRIPALDVDAWTSEMRKLISEPSSNSEASRAKRISQAATFDWHRSAALVEDAYTKLRRG